MKTANRAGFRTGRRVAGVVLAGALALVVPAVALAHPLGNFTINHFAAIRVAPDRVSLDVVIDRAEIPAFQESQVLDTDGDGSLSAAELEAAREPACAALLPELLLMVDGRAVAPTLVSAGLSTAPGAGGLSTMRLVCELEAALTTPIGASSTVSFADRSFEDRIGWREIVVLGDGVQIGGPASGAPADADGVSARLTSYPKDLLTQPLDARSVTLPVSPGGPALAAWTAPDAQALPGAAVEGPIPNEPASNPGLPAGAVPGGIAENLAALVDVGDLTPLAILASLAIAFGLGMVHALSPGHGKTIMAAYLVGARGSSRQAIGLGLAVTVSHTLGVLALAVLTLGASNVLPPERLYPVLGVASGGLVIAIGTSLLWSRLRATGILRHRAAPARDQGHPRYPIRPFSPGGAPAAGAHGRSPADGHGHSHGPGGHSHAPVGDGSISWRGLVALGLSGGLVPSASALILLLGSIAAGRVAYGLVLVLGFGLGMAVVLAGIGLLVVNARRVIERRPSIGGLRRFTMPMQLATASLVVVLGIVLTGQALTQVL